MIDYRTFDVTANSPTTSGQTSLTFERPVDLTAGSFSGVKYDSAHSDVRGTVSLSTGVTSATAVTLSYNLTTPGASSTNTFLVRILVVVGQQ